MVALQNNTSPPWKEKEWLRGRFGKGMAEFLLIRDLFIKMDWRISGILGGENRINTSKEVGRGYLIQGNISNLVLPQAGGKKWQSVCWTVAKQYRGTSLCQQQPTGSTRSQSQVQFFVLYWLSYWLEYGFLSLHCSTLGVLVNAANS